MSFCWHQWEAMFGRPGWFRCVHCRALAACPGCSGMRLEALSVGMWWRYCDRCSPAGKVR